MSLLFSSAASSPVSNIFTNFVPLFPALKCDLVFVSSFQVIAGRITCFSSPNKALTSKLDFSALLEKLMSQ